jgi:hypothetical protein
MHYVRDGGREYRSAQNKIREIAKVGDAPASLICPIVSVVFKQRGAEKPPSGREQKDCDVLHDLTPATEVSKCVFALGSLGFHHRAERRHHTNDNSDSHRRGEV